jgi:hypothetical protein
MKTVTFKTPIPYGDGKLAELNLRQPKAGDLRGLKLLGLHNMEWDTVATLVPRIATQPVTAGQLAELEAPDVMAVMETVLGFFGD